MKTILTPEDMLRLGIISYSPKSPTILPYVIFDLVRDMKNVGGMSAAWVDKHIDPNITMRNPVVHVFSVCVDGASVEIMCDTSGTWSDYGKFSVLGRADGDTGFDAFWDVCQRTEVAGDFTRQEVESRFKPRPLANAILVITSDGKMLCVRRSPKMHLHPDHLHCNGWKVKQVAEREKLDIFADAKQAVFTETAIPIASLSTPHYYGLSGNTPFDEVIMLFTVTTTLTEAEVRAVYGRAIAPDGGVVFYDFTQERVQHLLEEKMLTPSFTALLAILDASAF